MADLATALARDNVPELVSNLDSNAINKFERKISAKGVVSMKRIYFIYLEWKYQWYY